MKYFFRTTSINYSGVIFQGKSLFSLPGGILLGVSCPGVVAQGGIIQRKMFEGQKSRENCPMENFMGVTIQG